MSHETFDELRIRFNAVPSLSTHAGGMLETVCKCIIFGKIGELATKGDEQAIHFLVEHLSHENPFLRYSAVGYIRDIPDIHLKQARINTIQRLKELTATEKDEVILSFMKRVILERTTSK